tara:strand:- start:1059 stop:2423 length:1365 start_codon:yes stop_codon:yes gene_type:complete
MSNFREAEATIQRMIAGIKEVNTESGKLKEGMGKEMGKNLIAGLSRFDNSVGQVLFKFRGLQDSFKGVGEMMKKITGSNSVRKELLVAAKGYKGVGKIVDDLNEKLHKGEILLETHAEQMNALKEIGLVDDKGRAKKGTMIEKIRGAPKKLMGFAIGMMRNVKSFISLGLKFMKNAFILGGLFVLGFALLFPVIQKLWPKIKELAPTIKENFLKVLEIFKPVWEAVKSFIDVLFDPNATWIEKIGAYLKIFWELAKGVITVIWKALMMFIQNLPNMAKGIWDYVVWPLLKGFLMGIGKWIWGFLPSWLQDNLVDIANMVVGIKEKLTAALNQYLGFKETVGQVKGSVEGDEESQHRLLGKLLVGFMKTKNFVTGRADGGPVMAGRPYMVGERGPELFMPNASGTIIPNGAGNTINVHVNGRLGASDNELRDIARRVGQMVNKQINRTTSSGVRL